MKSFFTISLFVLIYGPLFSQSVERKIVDGTEIIRSKTDNSTVVISDIETVGKEARVFLVIENNSNQPFNFFPKEIKIIQTTKNGKSETVSPFDPNEFIQKIKNKSATTEALAATSRSMGNESAGDQSVYINSESGSGIVSTTDRNAVSRANQRDKELMYSRLREKSNKIDNLSNGILRANTIEPGQFKSGFIYFPLKSKKVKSLKYAVQIGEETHEIEF